MDQHNQKSLIPDFTGNGFTGQFNGIPHGNASSLMSTLHTLQMQTIGSQILPQPDLHNDYQNKMFMEQLSAMQNMYNSFNGTPKLDPKFSQISQTNLTIPNFSSITGTEPSTSSNFYSSIPSTSGLKNSVSQSTISASTLPLTLPSSLLLDNKLGANLNMKLPQTTIPQAQAAVEDWMKNICVDTILNANNKNLQSTSSINPLSTSLSLSTATLPENAFQLAATSFLQAQTPLAAATLPTEVILSPTIPPKAPSPEIQIVEVIKPCPVKVVLQEPVPTTSSSVPVTGTTTLVTEKTTTSGSDYDEAHDDVDNIFGLSLPEDDVVAGSLYRRPSSVGPGLSPIAFTPPDSPQHELTFDELFGLTPSKKDKTTTEEKAAKPEEPAVKDVPSTSAEPVQPSPVIVVESPAEKAAREEEDEFLANFVKPERNVPVYKQRAALMSLEAREAAKKEDPNYDAFEFDDDDDMFGEPSTETKKEPDAPKKIEQPKAKSVYITGVGFEVQGTSREHKRWQPKHVAPVVHNDLHNDKSFYTVADKLRTRRDEEFTSWFMKPEQSSSTECAKNTRKCTKEEPLLPKFIIRIDQLQTHTSEPMSTRKRYKRKNQKSDNEDSDYDDVSYRRRKITRKVYSLHKETDANFRRTVLEFPVGPCVPEDDRKRVNMFGPAEGILPKGTYVVCKSDMLRDDCAVWRVDNQNLLQKFPQLRNSKTNKLVYRSSSTYSGWCEQISSQYFRVSVRIIKQTRSETTVEPEIPLAELFCASSVEWFRHPGTVLVKEPEEKKEEEEKEKPAEDVDEVTEKKRTALTTVLNACLAQVFTKKHIESLVEKNDFTFIRSLEEIEVYNKIGENLIKKRIPVEMKHNKYIGMYTRLAISKCSFYSLGKCQICKRKKPRRVIHFFDTTSYDKNLNVDSPEPNIRDENWEDLECPVVADAISCGRCSMAIEFLHNMHHLPFHMLRICETKMEEIGTTDIDLSQEKIVDAARADKEWIESVIQKYLKLWEQVRYEFRDV